ncbi:receptor-binding cancer antigen expressed on SiSo cells-like isoform X2 [Penaeus chinensis]|nr:receptor-binding cancer antigen expressed on SiSo cells-like isoform X2 [Penaeus chinensis]
MILMIAVKKVKSLLLLILSLVRRCFCCLRKRRHSDAHLPIAVTGDGELNSAPSQPDEGLGGWDSWDVPSSVVSDGGGRSSLSPEQSLLQQQINQYRLSQQRKMQETEGQEEEEPNYFQDLAPSIEAKPQVVILERPEEEQQVSNRLSFTLSDPLLQSSELEDWVDDSEGWEGEADEGDLDAVLREKRQYERERRRQEHLRRKAERDAARTNKLATSKIATKIS